MIKKIFTLIIVFVMVFGLSLFAYSTAEAVLINISSASNNRARAQGVDILEWGIPPASISSISGGASSESIFSLNGFGVESTGATFRVDMTHSDPVPSFNSGGIGTLRFSIDVDTPYQIVGGYTATGANANIQRGVSLFQTIPTFDVLYQDGANKIFSGVETYTPGSGAGFPSGILNGGATYDFNYSFVIDPLSSTVSGSGFMELQLGNDVQVVPEPATIALLGIGLAGLGGGYLRRRRKKIADC